MFQIADKKFESRLILGTAGYPSLQVLLDAISASKTEMVTVGIRRLNVVASEKASEKNNFLEAIKKTGIFLLPNTAGCYTAKEAILTAKLARESLETNWVKLEVIGDSYSLFPDNEELLKAASELVQEGFTVLPYCLDDPVICRKLIDVGCSCVMPLGAPIGSGQGIRNPKNLELIRSQIKLPVIVDAGVGVASHASYAMELGVDAVLMNTAVAKAIDPVKMATAMRLAVESGRLAFEAGRIPQKNFATPSTPERGKII